MNFHSNLTNSILNWAKEIQICLYSRPCPIQKGDMCINNKKMGEFGGQNAHSTLNTDCEPKV